MSTFNSCKYIWKMNGLEIYVNTTNKNSVDVLFKALNSCKYMGKRKGLVIYVNRTNMKCVKMSC